MVLLCIEVKRLEESMFPARGYCNRWLQCYRSKQFSGAEVGSENCKFGIYTSLVSKRKLQVWNVYLCTVMRIASLRPVTILLQICTVWCTKLRKEFTAILEEVFYRFTIAIGFPGDTSDYNEGKRSAVAARMQNKVVVE